jgi:hypothetical protein
MAQDRQPRFPNANAVTVWRTPEAAGWTQRSPQKTAAPSDSGRTPSGSIGHPRVTGDSRKPQTGVQDESDSSADPDEVRGNPPNGYRSADCRGVATSDWTIAPVSSGGHRYCTGLYDDV